MPPTTEPDESVASPAAAESGEDRPGVRRILLVDDHPLVADGLRILVEALEPATTLLWTGTLEEGLDTLASERDIMLVLLDLRLPKIDGLEVLREIKNCEGLKRIPVVVLTTSQAEIDASRAYDCHANSYLIKPLDFELFTKLMEELGFYWLGWNYNPWS